MSKEAHTPLPWQWHQEFPRDDRLGSIYHDRRPGHAYAVAVQPKYQHVDRWKADAELIVRSVNAMPALVKALENVRMQQIGRDLYLGVIADDGCWSVIVPPEGRHIFEQWFETVKAALALVKDGK